MINKISHPKIIFIVGMHRSGTSLAAQLLSRWGAWMGEELMIPDEFNQDGYWEYIPLVDFHKKILNNTHNTWVSPINIPDTATLVNNYGDEARELVHQMDQQGQTWCWKDPRMFAFLDFWKEILRDREIIFIVTARNPLSIAESLLKRDGILPWVSLTLWEYSMSAIFDFLTASDAVIYLNYDTIIQDPGIQVTHLYDQLNLLTHDSKPADNLKQMLATVKPGLNRASHEFEWDLSPHQKELYAWLLAGNVTGYNIKDKNLEWMQKHVLSFYKEMNESGYHFQFVQIYFLKNKQEYSEKDSIRQVIYGSPDFLTFKFAEINLSNSLRFDPLNKPCLVKIMKINFFRQKEKLNYTYKLNSPGFIESDNVFLFNDTDPQIFIEIISDDQQGFDELTIEILYLARGSEVIPILNSKQKNLLTEIEEKIKFQEKLHQQEKLEIKSKIHELQQLIVQKEQEINSLKSVLSITNNELRTIISSNPYKFSVLLGKPAILFNPRKLFRSFIELSKRLTIRKLIKQSGLFDEEYYLEDNPDVRNSGMQPLSHYLKYGSLEGRKPSPGFDTSFYIENNRDVILSGLNPLVHYLLYGKKEGRKIQRPANEDAGFSDLALYQDWILQYDTLTTEVKNSKENSINDFLFLPLLSVIMPVYNPNPVWLTEAIESVLDQIYPNWELCIADDCSTDPAVEQLLQSYSLKDSRVKVVFRKENGHISAASNSAIEIAKGDYIVLLDHDDILPADTLFCVAESINQHPEIKLIYSDEDKINSQGERSNPYFKCDWNPELFYSHNMINHLGVYQTQIVRKIGGFRIGFEGSQDYDLALRFIEYISPKEIFHIPKVLYHWRMHEDSTSSNENSKGYAYASAENALNEHFTRTGQAALACVIRPGMYRVSYSLPNPIPLVTIIIPTKNNVKLLKKCIKSILMKTTYSKYEILIIDNNSDEEKTLKYLSEIQEQSNIRCIQDKRPFNFSAICNNAVKEANGEYICLLNDDIEVISQDWLESMLSWAARPGIGAVGAKLLYPDYTIQHAGIILGIGGVAGHPHKYLNASTYGYFGRAILDQEMSAVTAACLLIRKTIYIESGGLDEVNLTIAFNDVDFGIRLKEAGYRNIWTPYAELIHHESASRGMEDTDEKVQRFKTEIDFMIKKWGDLLHYDPAYNPNLTLKNEQFGLAWPPRPPKTKYKVPFIDHS